MTKKHMQARITELEMLVVSLNAAIAALSAQHTIYVGPLPAQPTPIPYSPIVPLPYIGDPPNPWGGPNTTGIGTIVAIGGSDGVASQHQG
jgi:hypothetical protein